MNIVDFAKMDAPAQLLLAHQALHRFREQRGGELPRPWHEEDAQAMHALAEEINAASKVASYVASFPTHIA